MLREGRFDHVNHWYVTYMYHNRKFRYHGNKENMKHDNPEVRKHTRARKSHQKIVDWMLHNEGPPPERLVYNAERNSDRIRKGQWDRRQLYQNRYGYKRGIYGDGRRGYYL